MEESHEGKTNCSSPYDPDPDDFNQGILLPSLILQLRSILERYPDDGQILKEIIQNAEDAGASKVIFLIDNTTYGTDVSKLHHKGLAKYQGPALYAYNDSVFRYADWKGIRMLDSSVKADDPLKIGRFGLGFKSVFHMTDLPSIFSGKGIGFIDPHKECFKYQPPGCRTKEKTTAFFFHLDKDHDEIARLEDQFEPFKQPLFGVTAETFKSKYFNGTVLRFPFRTADIMSDLSKTTYDREKVLDLVLSLNANAHHMLLFLRKLQCVEVYEKTQDGKTSKLLEIKIEESYRKLIKQKLAEFQRKINIEWRGQSSVSVTYPIAMKVEIWGVDASAKTTNVHVWLVSQYYAGAEESPAVTLSSDKGHLPLVGVALPIEASSGQTPCDTEPGGHVFCFLPLPLERKSPTGLKFHVHGNFAVDQNRRHIKWPSADRDATRLTEDALLWNKFLVNVVLPKAVLGAIAYLTQMPPSDGNIPTHFLGVLKEGLRNDAEFIARLVYAVFPNVALVNPQWTGLTEAIYRHVWTQRFFHTLPGKWIAYRDAIFECIDAIDPVSKLIESILCEDKRNLVSIPRYVTNQLPVDAKYVTPNIVRDSLRNVQYQKDLKDEERRCLLDYLLQFSKDTDLVGLVLLPLEDGTWTEFETARSVKKVYVASKEHPQSLLPGLEGRFLKSGIALMAIKPLIERGATQLKYLNSRDFRKLLGDVLGKWQTNELVTLENESWFTRTWLERLWNYLQDHFRTELHLFEGLHILILGNGYVAKLSQQLPVVSRIDSLHEGGKVLSEELVNLCNQVGVVVLKDPEPAMLQHSSIWNTYVLRPNARGVLTALQRLNKQTGNKNVVALFKGVPDGSKKYFRNFIGHWIYFDRSLTMDDVNLLKTLPIFPTVSGSGGQVVAYVSVAEGTRVAPLRDDIPVPCPEVLLDTSDEISYLLGITLGVNPPHIPDHLNEVYFPAVFRNYYNQDKLIKLMLYVCKNLLPFEKINKNIVPIAKEINFVPIQNGNLVKPSDVYLKDELLGKLFVGEDVFPVGEFAKDEFKVALLRLGMKTADLVTPQEVLAVAEKLSGRTNPNQFDLEQSEALMKFLNQHGHKLLPCIISEGRSSLLQKYEVLLHKRSKDNSLQHKLTKFKWVQISSTRPPLYPYNLTFIAENLDKRFVPPNEVFTQEYAYLVGSVRCTIDTNTFPYLAKCFNWKTKPQIHDVLCHLNNTIAIYDATEKAEVLCIVNHVYKYFSEHMCRPTSIKMLEGLPHDTELHGVLRILQSLPWVWHGDGFARANQMVLKDSHGIVMKPYVHVLPKEIVQFLPLWRTCNIREECNPIEVLHAIKKAHDENDTALRNKEHDLKLAVNILNAVANYTLTGELRQRLVVPIITGNELLEMKSVEECTYCDNEWYQQGYDVDDVAEKVYLIHELIPLTTAEKLNIPSLISKTIGAEELEMEYGQSEPLTRRLQSLLSDYTDGLAVLKELIQNADDAGASEIRFLYDERSNEDARESLLDKGMKDLQGPALWTYNDAVFTDSDFESIIKLSGATKDSVTEKIGRFGLGFNAVYNLTDVPMFISRQFIVIFDPHTTYLGRVLTNKTKPGIKLNLDRHLKKIRRLSDQFKPMNGIFGCELGSDSTMKSYNGTLFRFPLRTLQQANQSKISHVCYNREEILKLLKLLYDAGESLLLYTQTVRKITVYHLPEVGSPPDGIREWFSIQKDLVTILRNIPSTCAATSEIQAQCAILKQATAILDGYRTNPRTRIQTLDSSSVLKFTVTNGIEFPKDFQRNPSSHVTEWLVVSSLGTSTSLRMAFNSEKKNIVPVGGVAARLERTKDGRYRAVSVDEQRGGMLLCFLPLPIRTCFPIHINGFFDVHSSRMHLYERSPLDKNVDSRAAWNEALLDDAVTRAYCVLLADLARLSPGEDSYVLWPTRCDSGLIGRLTESVYRSICSSLSEHNVVKTPTSWTTVLKSKILSQEFRGLEIGKVAILVLETILKYSQNDEHSVDIPDNITQAILQTSCAKVIRERIVSKVDFYKSWFLPNIGVTNPLQRDQLILHALSDRDIVRHLKERNCIPVSPGGLPLKSIEELIHPESEIAVLFDVEEGRFPKWTSGVVIDSHIYERLVHLGMRKDDLPWPEILVRVKLISMYPGTSAKRTPVILALIEKKLRMKSHDSNASDAVFGQIQNVKFLPVMKKPEDFPLKWKGDDYSNNSLVSCKDGYLKTRLPLVCCSYPIIDETVFASNSCSSTKHKLGLENKPIDPEVLLLQVMEVITMRETTNGLSPEHLSILTEVYNACFGVLNTRLVNGTIDQSAVSSLVSCKSIRLRSNYFLTPDRCATKFKHGNDALLPYLAVVPLDLAISFPCLLKTIGVKESFSLDDYIRILKEIRDQTGNSCLDEDKLGVAIHLLTMCVYEELQTCPTNVLRRLDLNEMPIPNAEGKMCPAKNLCFNNCLWLTCTTERSTFCHGRIAHEIASALGLRTIREDILKRHQLAFPFGQRERLVNRIKSILKEYPYSEDILKEMLQNADDVGAKEIHFILDTRHLPDEKVFEDSWKPLQGPALCIYNDKPFSQSDLNGIQRLGEGGKVDDPTTTGQYGVGFNCVYHLTDVPTFITTVENVGTVLCAFDPNCKFVPGATSVDPGAMFKIEQTLKEQFIDVFKGYSFEYKQYDVSQTGTLFRLPLRNQATAQDSEISKKLVTVKDVDGFFEKFESDLSESLLFVNSIEKIQLVRVTAGKGNSEQREVLYEVNAKITEEARRKRTEFSRYVKDCAKKIVSRQMSLTEIQMREISYQMEMKDSRGNEDVWQIVQRFGFAEGSVIPDKVVRAAHSGKLGLLPRGGVAFLIETTKTMKRQSRLFCYLPLPVPVQLPVHLNGHFALHQNRRNLWKDEHKDYLTEWNTCLMEGVVAPAYCALLSAMRNRIIQWHSQEPPSLHLEGYFEVFPQLTNIDGFYVNHMVTYVYWYIIFNNVDVLPLQSDARTLFEIEWKHPRGDNDRKIYFDVLDQISGKASGESILPRYETFPLVEGNRPVENRSVTVRKLLVRCGFSLFWCPQHVREYFVRIGKHAGVSIVNPIAVWDFFATYSCPGTRCKVMNLPDKINNTPYQDIESLVTLLEYCTEEPKYKERLDGMPFLVTEDNVVSQFNSRMVKYVSIHSRVSPHIPGQFMHLSIKHALNVQPGVDVTLCKDFTIKDFALTLFDSLRKPEVHNTESFIQISELDDVLKPYNTNGLQWLRNVWLFLSSFLKGMSCRLDNQVKEVVNNLLRPVMPFCLLPVLTPKCETLLYPLCLSSAVVAEPSTTESCNEVVTLLYALGVAKPNYSYIYNKMKCSEIDELLKYILGTVQQPATVIEALRIAMKHRLVEFKVTYEGGLLLLEYLSMNINRWKDLPHTKATIVKLPFFLTVGDMLTSLDNSTAYVFPSGIPSSGIESLITGQDIRLLKTVGNIEPLLRHLGFIYLNTENVYCSFIFKYFQNLPSNAQQVHMDFVKQHVLYLKHARGIHNVELNRFLDCLANLAFIPNRSNSLCPASEFYDPHNEVFQVMHEEERFPPDPYNTKDWLQFLQMCGLVHKVTKEKFMSYAQQVERSRQSGINNETLEQSETLVRHFLNREDHTLMELELLRNIRFVCPGIASESLRKLHVQYGTVAGKKRLRFICFSGATLYENEELVWTVQNLLPKWILSGNYSPDVLGYLQVSVPLQSTTVAEHVEKLCSSLGTESLVGDTDKINTLKRVLGKAFAYFKENGVLGETVKSILSRTRCIFVTDPFEIIAPNQVAIDITTNDEIRPYLYKIPLDLGSYTSVLLQLGTTKVLTTNQYAFALKEIANASLGKEMHPEEMKASCRATERFLRLLKGGQVYNGEIFLPCIDKKLHKSSELVVNDRKDLLQRLSKFECPIMIDSKDLNMKSGDFEKSLQKMQSPQRPRLLSHIVHEDLADGRPKKCDFVEKVTARLLHPTFKSGFERIVRHCVANDSSSQGSWNEENLKQKCKELTDRLDKIEVICRDPLKTYLKIDGKELDGSQQNIKYYHKKTLNGGVVCWKFYISIHACGTDNGGQIYREIAEFLNNILEQKIDDKSLLALVGILDCPITQICEVLNSNKIMESESPRSFVPPLGCKVPQEYLHLLIQDNFSFYPTQLVALEKDDPFDRGDEGEPVFILVQIVERLDSELLAKYRIRINDTEELIVNATLLYTFSRANIEIGGANIEIGGANIEMSNDQQLVIRAIQEQASSPKSTPKASPKPNDPPRPTESPKAKTIEEAVAEIKKLLKEAWKGTPEEWRRVKKRLYLKWHPDKNPDQVEFSTEVCKILQHLINLLESGKSIDDYGISEKTPTASRTDSGFESGFRETYRGPGSDDFYFRAGQRARYFNQRRDHSSSNSSGRHSGGFNSPGQEYENFFTGFRKSQNPQPGEARRWMRQARHDLGAVENDHNAFDWKCLKCFEATKIALMAVQYATDSNSVPSNLDRIDIILNDIGDGELRRLSLALEHLVIGLSHMKYPSSHDSPWIPGEVYCESHANEAYRLSKQILDRCAQIIERS